MQNEQLLSMLQTLIGRLKQGDREAIATAKKLKATAKADQSAELAFNTLSALYWERNSPTWKKAEAFYDRLVRDDQQAWARVRMLHQQVHEQNEKAAKAFAMLKAVHNQRRRSVWYPGAAKIGHYPMPKQNRPGIVIGGYLDMIGAPYQVDIDPNLANLLSQIPGMLPPQPAPSPIPGLPGWPQIPGMPQIPGLPGYPPPLPPGIPPAFLPLTQQAMTGLSQLISQARQSVPQGSAAYFSSSMPMDNMPMGVSNPMLQGGGTATTTVPASTAMSTVPRPAQSFATARRGTSLTAVVPKPGSTRLSSALQHKAMTQGKPSSLPTFPDTRAGDLAWYQYMISGPGAPTSPAYVNAINIQYQNRLARRAALGQ
jgi:hypothetical protein